MDANKSVMEAMEAASEAGSPRTQVTKSSKSGITLHYMTRSELGRAVNSFQELKQIVAEENASDQSNNSKELERRIKELEHTITGRNRILKETVNLSRSLVEHIKYLEAQLNTKEHRIQSTEARKEELEQQLRESSWCNMKLLREEVSELQKADRLKDEENHTLKNSSAELQSVATQLLTTYEEERAELKDKLKSSKEVREELLAKKSSLEGECKNLTALMDEKVKSLQEEKQKIEEGTGALKETIQSLEDKIQGLQDKAEEAGRNHREELESSKQAQDKLEATRTALQVECKSTQSKTKLMDDEIKSLKAEAQKTADNADALGKTNQSLEESIQSTKKEAEETIRVLKEWYNELLAKHEAYENDSKIAMDAKEQQIRNKDEENQELIHSLEDTIQGLEDYGELHDELLAKHEAYENESKISMDAKEQQIRNKDEENQELIHSLEDKIQGLQDKAEEAGRNHREELKSSKQAQDKLEATRTALQVECKRTQSKTKLIDDEIKSLKAEAQKAADNADALGKTNQSLEESIQSTKKEAEETIRVLKEWYNELLAKHKVHGNESKIAMDAKEQQIRNKDEEVRALKEDADNCKAELEGQEGIIKLYKKDLVACKKDNKRTKAKVASLTEDLNSQSKVNESLDRQLNESIKVRAAMKERISYLEGKLQQDEHVEPSSPQVEAHSDFAGVDEYNSVWAGGGIGPLSSDDEEEVADEAGKSNASSDQSDHEHPCKPTPCNASQGQSNLHCKEGTLSGADASSNGSSRSRNADDGVQENATGSSLSDVCDTSAPPEQAASETDTIEHTNSLEPEKNKDSVSDCSKSKSQGNIDSSPAHSELSSEHIVKESNSENRKISSEAGCEMVDASTDTNGSRPNVLAQMAVNAETSSEPSPHQENRRRGLRKRKARQVFTPLMSTKENAERMQEKVETPKAKKNKEAKANTASPGEVKVGSTGSAMSINNEISGAIADAASFKSCASINEERGLHDFPEQERFPNGSVCLPTNDQDYKPSWCLLRYAHTRLKDSYCCQGIYTCPQKDCQVKANPVASRSNTKKHAPPDHAKGTGICPMHKVKLVHRSCTALFFDDTDPITGEHKYTHVGEHKHGRPHAKLSRKGTNYEEEEIVGCPFIEKGLRDRMCKVDVGGVQQGQHKSVQCTKYSKGKDYDGMCMGHYRAFKIYGEPTADPLL